MTPYIKIFILLLLLIFCFAYVGTVDYNEEGKQQEQEDTPKEYGLGPSSNQPSNVWEKNYGPR